MIREITELNFPSYATLAKATVTLKHMGDKTITSQVSIDGQIAPDFSYDWEVLFKGEKYIMPLRKPQASKGNDSLSSKIDLTFKHWAQYQLSRWFFFTLQPDVAGVAVADKYNASVSLNLKDFCDLFGQLLDHYFDGAITIDLNPEWAYSQEQTFVEINYSYLWDVLIKLNELYDVVWEIVPNGSPDKYIIKVGYDNDELDHIFEYGFEGGLLKVERQVQDDNIRNMLLGRGGEKNLPYRYFKNVDPKNDSFPADPDWIYELANVYFDRLRSAEFRSYVQGWKYAHKDEYAEDLKEGGNSRLVGIDKTFVKWAWQKGYTDVKFDPVEFVADEIATDSSDNTINVQLSPTYSPPILVGSSIDEYGPLLGGLDDNEEIYPSIQRVELPGLGRIDQAVDVEQVTTDDIEDNSSMSNVNFIERITFPERRSNDFHTLKMYEITELTLNIGQITIGPDQYGIGNDGMVDFVIKSVEGAHVIEIEDGDYRYPDYRAAFVIKRKRLVAVDSNGEEISIVNIPTGTYTLRLKVEVENESIKEWYNDDAYVKLISKGVYVDLFDSNKVNISKEHTFDIWVKNIWQTQKGEDETAEEYVRRVWEPIIGNHLGEETAVCFASGMLSTSEDYQFLIAGPSLTASIHYDTSKTLSKEGEPPYFSEWRITCIRSDADYDALGMLVPNTTRQGKAGDYIYFVGIELTQYYIEWAEQRLHNYKLDELEKIKDIIPTWVVGLDKVRIGVARANEAVALINQLRLGGSIRLADKRFILNTDEKTENGVAYLPLYLQTITYKFNEGNTANLTPNVELTLSNEYATTANPVATLQGQVDVISRQIGSTMSLSNLQQIVRMVGDKIYLRKDGITDRSYSPTYFDKNIGSLGFLEGAIGGQGWSFYKDENGKWVLELDHLIVRENLQVNELVLNQIQARGGMIIESLASIEVSDIQNEGDGIRKIYFDTKGGSISNHFVEDDIVYGHKWSADETESLYYKYRVQEVGLDYIYVTDEEKDGDGIPMIGDILVQYGNYTDKNRQFVIIRDMMGGGYERMLSGLDSVTAKGTEYYFAGYQSSVGERFFVGNREKGQYIEYKNGKLYIPGSLILGTEFKEGATLEEYLNGIDKAVEETSQNVANYKYLYDATNQGTLINKGLVLTSLIQLGEMTATGYQVWSGINGLFSTSGEKGIAAWYGGEMKDGEREGWDGRYAKSLFRFDGSGYISGGYISWNPDGSGHLANGNISWSADGTLTLNNGLQLAGGKEGVSDTIKSVVELLNKFTTNFVPQVKDGNGVKDATWAQISGSNPLAAVKSKVGFFSEDFISAKGYNNTSSTGGGGGATRLSDLQDVSISGIQKGNGLAWNGSKWVVTWLPDEDWYQDMEFYLEVIESDISTIFKGITGNASINDIEVAYNGYNLREVIVNILKYIGASYTTFEDTSLNGIDLSQWIRALYAWTGLPSADASSWENETPAGVKVDSLNTLRSRIEGNMDFYRTPRPLIVNNQHVGNVRIITQGNDKGSMVILLETFFVISNNSVTYPTANVVKTYASQFSNNAWSDWKLINSINL